MPDFDRAVIIALERLADLPAGCRMGRDFVVGHFHAVEASGATDHHVQVHVLDFGHVGGGQRHGQETIGLVAGSRAAARPAFGLDQVNPQGARHGQSGLVHVPGCGFSRAPWKIRVPHAWGPWFCLDCLKMRPTVFRSPPRGGSKAIFPFLSMVGNFSVSFIHFPVPSL